LATVAALLLPTIASATYITTNVETGYNVTLHKDGGGLENAVGGAWETNFYSGTVASHSSGNFLAGPIYTYCVSTTKQNTPSDSYDLTTVLSLTGEYGTNGLSNALRYVLENFGTSTTQVVRAAAQVAIWQALHDFDTNGAAAGGTGVYSPYAVTGYADFTGGQFGAFYTNYVSIMTGVNTYLNTNTPYVGQSPNPDWFASAGGPGGAGENQNMIWYQPGGPPGGLVGEVPLPGTAYGAAALVVMLLAGRRMLGFVA